MGNRVRVGLRHALQKEPNLGIFLKKWMTRIVKTRKNNATNVYFRIFTLTEGQVSKRYKVQRN